MVSSCELLTIWNSSNCKRNTRPVCSWTNEERKTSLLGYFHEVEQTATSILYNYEPQEDAAKELNITGVKNWIIEYCHRLQKDERIPIVIIALTFQTCWSSIPELFWLFCKRKSGNYFCRKHVNFYKIIFCTNNRIFLKFRWKLVNLPKKMQQKRREKSFDAWVTRTKQGAKNRSK